MTETEEQTVSELKQVFYYGATDIDGINKAVSQIKSSYEGKDWLKIVNQAINELSYEQARRRDYITDQLGLGQLTKQQLDTVILSLALNPSQVSTAVKKFNGLIQSPNNLSPELQQQAQYFKHVDVAVSSYFASQKKQELMPIFTILKKLSQHDLTELSNIIHLFIEKVGASYQDNGGENLVIPQAITEKLQKYGLESICQGKKYIDEIVTSLNQVNRIILAILASYTVSSTLIDDDVLNTVALWAAEADPVITVDVNEGD